MFTITCSVIKQSWSLCMTVNTLIIYKYIAVNGSSSCHYSCCSSYVEHNFLTKRYCGWSHNPSMFICHVIDSFPTECWPPIFFTLSFLIVMVSCLCLYFLHFHFIILWIFNEIIFTKNCPHVTNDAFQLLSLVLRCRCNFHSVYFLSV